VQFRFLVAVVVAGGALMGAAVQFLVASPGPAFAAGQSSASTKVSFNLSDLNPIKLIYDEVMKQVAADANRPSFAVGTPVPMADFSKMDTQIKLNNERFQRMSGPGNISGMPESDPR